MFNDSLNSTQGSNFDFGRFSQAENAWSGNFAPKKKRPEEFNFPDIRHQQNFNFPVPNTSKIGHVPSTPKLGSKDSISDMVQSGKFNATLNDTRESIPQRIKKIKKKLDFPITFEW